MPHQRWRSIVLLIFLSANSNVLVQAFVRPPTASNIGAEAPQGRLSLRAGALKLDSGKRRDDPLIRPNNPSKIKRLSTSLTAYKNGENGSNKDPVVLSERTKGLLVLLTVPIAWGTYVPVVRYLYAIQPAVPGFVFSACYYLIASVTTLTMVAYQDRKSMSEDSSNPPSEERMDPNNGTTDETQKSSAPFPIWAGLELGAYLFVANCLQVIGLKTVPSDRAGFLVQLTTVMVPVAEALFAGNLLLIPAQTWFSCLLAFAGICVMNLDGLGGSSMATVMLAFKTFTQGDVLILGAAILYTLHVVRLGRYAKETTPLKLAASKATVETVYSFGFVLALMAFTGSGLDVASGGLLSFGKEMGAEISNFFSTISKGLVAGTVPKSAILSALGATLWTGLVTCAYTIYAQSYGQRRVNPTTANLVYSIQPITTSLFAFLLLRRTMGPAGVVGGVLIGAAIYLVTTRGDMDSENEKGGNFNGVVKPLRINGEQKENSILLDSEETAVDVNR